MSLTERSTPPSEETCTYHANALPAGGDRVAGEPAFSFFLTSIEEAARAANGDRAFRSFAMRPTGGAPGWQMYMDEHSLAVLIGYDYFLHTNAERTRVLGIYRARAPTPGIANAVPADIDVVECARRRFADRTAPTLASLAK